jgi:hypothetical protein
MIQKELLKVFDLRKNLLYLRYVICENVFTNYDTNSKNEDLAWIMSLTLFALNCFLKCDGIAKK